MTSSTARQLAEAVADYLTIERSLVDSREADDATVVELAGLFIAQAQVVNELRRRAERETIQAPLLKGREQL